MSVTFNENIELDIVTNKSTIVAKNPGLPQSPKSHRGRVRRTRVGSVVSIDAVKLRSYRLIVIFGICFIVSLFSLPIIFYYTESSSERNDVNSCGNGTNISEVYILHFCTSDGVVYVCII